jgi:catechol 2,3-dioxygenase-like lactoylglutathione lyase family enzyme
MPTPPISEQITFLYTRDLATTATFYEAVLRLPLALDQGSCRIYHVTGNAFLGFCQRDKAPSSPQGMIVTLVTDQVDRWYQELIAHGVQIEKPPSVNPVYNLYHFFLRDPNGYLLEIQQFLDPNWSAGNQET